MELNNHINSQLEEILQMAKRNTEIFKEIRNDYKKAIELLIMAQKELDKFYLPNQCQALAEINNFLRNEDNR